MRFLIDSGANVNTVETRPRADAAAPDRRPLQPRAASAATSLLLLLDKGAKLDAKDAEGKTPLALAVENRNEGAAKLLRERGARE